MLILDSIIIDHNASGAGGAAAHLGSDEVVIPDSTITRNTARGPGADRAAVFVAVRSNLEIINTDWGTGSTENIPVDVFSASTQDSYDLTGVQPMTCDEIGCYQSVALHIADLAGVENLGLAQAFVTAGSSAVVASVRKVDDALAAAFTEALYEAGFGRVRPSEAFRAAVLAVWADRAEADVGAFPLFVP